MHTLIHICGWTFIGLFASVLFAAMLVFLVNWIFTKAFEEAWKRTR